MAAQLGPVIAIGGYPVLSTTPEKLADHLLAVIAARTSTALFFANTNFVVKNRFLLERADDLPVVLVNDGVGMDIAATLIHRTRFEQNLNGTDFVPFLFARADRPLRVYMIGGTPEVLATAVEHVATDLGQVVVGSSDGFAGLTPDLVGRVAAAAPDVVLVAMGNPLQERWILDHAAQLPPSVFVGVGALFDFWAGAKARAPEALRRLRLEWLYRLYLEPRRLARRYTLDIAVFLRACYRYR
ncbi:beta-1,4-glucosyltransferase [Conyzicola lurida]|uniref:Beta-1,4-glucosyltransferase n=1 Tax=Conyzicola lurida TaxID=1172621 RepID=A0A841AMD2_9MICO|nr:beta-1,4-glucosyltransferase [Conyzicola lurida]